MIRQPVPARLACLKTLVASGALACMTLSTPVHAETLNQIGQCVEIAPAVLNFSATRSSTRSDCNMPNALKNALAAASVRAGQLNAGRCRTRVTSAMAQQACAAVGLQPFNGTASLPPKPAPGQSSLFAAHPVSDNRTPNICVVTRERESDRRVTKQNDPICLFDGLKRSIVFARVEAHCAVVCR